MISTDSDFSIKERVIYDYLCRYSETLNFMLFENKMIYINDLLNKLNQNELKRFSIFLNEISFYDRIYSKMLKIHRDFFGILDLLYPATSLYYLEDVSIKDLEMGLSTCVFEDLKSYFQDSYESITSNLIIIKGLDNIVNRDAYDCFPHPNMTIEKFQSLSKGSKLDSVNKLNEKFSTILDLKNDFVNLRNAIGHNDFEYNQIEQRIVYKLNKDSDTIESKFLVEVALACLNQMKSSMILMYISLVLERKIHRDDNCGALPKFMYKNCNRNSRCPCGSMKNFGQCCKKVIKKSS